MKLTGKQVKQIHNTILDGYNPESLRRLVRVHLEENLHNITSGANFSDQVFTLVEWAEQQGRVVELTRAAHEENPNNATLQTLWRDVQTWFATLPAPTLRQDFGVSAQSNAQGTADEPSGELAEPPPAPQLFLSYSRHDTPVMQRLRVAIEAVGMSVWTDDGLEPGTSRWQMAIENAIRQTQAMVVILSPAAKQSEWVNIEVSVALRLHRRVFPVLVQGDDIDAVPINLFTTQHVDARSDLAGPVATKLLPALHKHLGMESSGVAMPAARLAELRGVLAKLYDDENRARLVVHDAGLDVTRIVFSGQAATTWHAIVQEADKAGKLADLLVIALRDYGENAQLQQVVAVLRSGGVDVPEVKPPVIDERSQQQSRNLADSAIVQSAADAIVVSSPTSTSAQKPTSTTHAAPPANPLAALLATMTDASLPPKTRLEAGLQAADLGDLPPDLDELVLMPAKAQLGYDFRIGKYPVTNHQYRRFIEAKGYTDDRWWPDKTGRDYRDRYKWRQPRYWNDAKFNRATQPVVGVSWYEAVAYCAWLSAQWQAAGQIGQNEQVQLPTQAEWIFAARAGKPEPKDKATDYPWQGPFDQAYANTKESGLEQTTPVHMYPSGRTPTGVWDMSGNVWEWTRDKSSLGYYLKGGSWYQGADQVTASAAPRSSVRRGFAADGLRVVVVPISR